MIITMTNEVWLSLGIILGLYVLSLIVGVIWLNYTTEPKPKQNKLTKKGKTNGR